MARYAVFVDAGYLFAQGAIALTGSKKPRSSCSLKESKIVSLLTDLGNRKCDGSKLLRIYWYDGALNFAGPTAEQTTLAHLDNVKLRLGFVNSQGQQKGVDSLIVTDIIDLARNRAIDDALLLSGDEDVRIGVVVAQNFGVRVHLVGIEPSRSSQSRLLLQEADTTVEWSSETVREFLTISAKSLIETPVPASNPIITPISVGMIGISAYDVRLETVIEEIVESLNDTEITRLTAMFVDQRTVPPEYDRRLLAMSRKLMGRDLTPSEKRESRNRFILTIKSKT